MPKRPQSCLCLAIILYLFAYLIHDAFVYHGILAENKIRLEREVQRKETLPHRLAELIQVAEKAGMPNGERENLKTLKGRWHTQ